MTQIFASFDAASEWALTGLCIAFENAPEAVPVSPSICDFSLSEVRHDELVLAHTRLNVSCAMRFSEPPSSQESRDYLCVHIRNALPSYPEEGLLPLRVFRLPRCEKEWIHYRAGAFTNYRKDEEHARRKMLRLFNVACSALVATNSMNDDKHTHVVTAAVPSMDAFPVRFDFTLPDMNSECGWSNQRPVFFWIQDTRTLVRATIQRAVHSFDSRELSVRLVAPVWAHAAATRTIKSRGVFGDQITISAYVKLGPPPIGADPVYEIISRGTLYLNFSRRGYQVLDTIYASSSSYPRRPIGPPQDNLSVRVSGHRLRLKPDQTAALQLADADYPVVDIQAAFGTGKTVVGALIAARTVHSKMGLVIATSTTNTAVAQFTETLLALDDYKDLEILRYVSDTALAEGAPTTPIDLHEVLKRLAALTSSQRHDCLRFKRGRELLELYIFDSERGLHLTEEEKEEYRLTELDCLPQTQGRTSNIIPTTVAHGNGDRYYV
ncbi:hypothetical protein Q1695_002691 [Nippostrongylus brasiliensis]|nr:hypothetical protein Q1695_002691 [Nippostrongylus brasiliensis]